MQIDSESAGQRWDLSGIGRGRWIFPARPEGAVNQIVDFLHSFDCNHLEAGAELLISADTDFAAWLNGHLVGHGQYSDYPGEKTYERLLLGGTLRMGSNTLAVTVFYNGRNSSVYRRGEPGLLYEVRGPELLAASGMATLCRANPCYHSDPIATVSRQPFFTFGYDARAEDGFNRDGFGLGGLTISDDGGFWWFTLAHCADGTFYFQPNRDYNASDFTNGGSRISASAVVALIFSAKKKNLYLTGAHRK